MQAVATPKSAEKQSQQKPKHGLDEGGSDLLSADELQAGLPVCLQCAGLAMGAPDDIYEREAESFAAAVTTGKSAGFSPARRQDRAPLPRLPIYQSTATLKTPDHGQPLAAPLRTEFEATLGADLGDIRIHDSAPAQAAAKSLHAKAFTNQNHIWLGPHQSPNDKRLIAHELTHVVQQGSGALARGTEDDAIFAVQRAPADYQHPEDGGEVYRRMQQRIAEATGEEQPEESATTSPSDAEPASQQQRRRAATDSMRTVDRAELAEKKGELAPEAKPTVDRPAAEQPRVSQTAERTKQEAESPSEPPGAEKKDKAEATKGEGKGKEGVDEAAAAAAIAGDSFAAADAEMSPLPETAVVPPAPVVPLDASGAPLPADPAADMQADSLAQQAQAMREQGFSLRAHATEERRNAAILRGNLHLVEQGLVQSDRGVERSIDHLTFRRGVVTQATQALTLSEEKAATVAREAPTYSAKADEGKAESGPMANESQSLSAENAANTPDDEEGAEKAREQGGKIDQAGRDIATTDDAISQTQARAAGLAEEAERAQGMNTETRSKITNINGVLEQTGAKLAQMGQQNQEARGEMAAMASQPDQLLAQANALDEQGMSLIDASHEIEQQVSQAQLGFARGMASVPAAKHAAPGQTSSELPMEASGAVQPSAAGGQPLEAETTNAEVTVQRDPADGGAPDAAVFAPSDDVAGSAPAPGDTAPAADLQSMDAETGDAADMDDIGNGGTPSADVADAAPSDLEGRYEDRTNLRLNESVTGALPSWVTGVPVLNERERAEASAAETARRNERMAQIQARADQVGGFENLSAGDKAAMALAMTRDNIFGSVGKIKWPGIGHLALGLIDPRGPLVGVVGGLSMTLSGAANLINMQQWRRDPIGNLLKSAADTATGLTVILGSITALAGVIIALMTAITILSFGSLAPITGPAIAFCTTILTTVGGWTIAVGQVALILQALVLIKNLIDAATAKTAEDLLNQSDQMTEDVSSAGNVLLQMGMAKLGEMGGKAAANEIRAAGGGVRFAAQMGARVRTLPSRAIGSVRSIGLRGVTGRAVAGVGELAVSGGRALRSLPRSALRATGRSVRSLLGRPGRIIAGVRGIARNIRTQGFGAVIRGYWRRVTGSFQRNFVYGRGIKKWGKAWRETRTILRDAREVSPILRNPARLQAMSAAETSNFLGQLSVAGLRPTLTVPIGSGRLTIVTGRTAATESEVFAARYMAERGNNVTLRIASGTRSGGGTSDLLVNGRRYDVYTPKTSSADRAFGEILRKNSQLPGQGGVVVDLRSSSLNPSDISGTDIIERLRRALAARDGRTDLNITEVIFIK
ncbi:MAG: DUF4157 domain-containing protein [Caldilineaceae bacterium]